MCLFLAARHVGFPSFDPGLEFQQRASSRRNDRAKQIPLSPSCRRVVSAVFPRVGDNVMSLINRESLECCVHLLQRELLVMCSALPARSSRREFQIYELLRDFRDLFS